MLLPSERIEYAIYSLIGQADPNEGFIADWATLGHQVGVRNGTVLLRFLKDLLAENLEAKKCLNTRDWRTYPDTTISDDDFFRHGHFRLYLTPKGLRRYQELMPKAKAQGHIDKILELESNLFDDAVSQMDRKGQETDTYIPSRYQGGFRKQKYLEARLKEIEELIRERVKFRRESLIKAPDLRSPEYMNDLREEIINMVNGRSVNLKSLMPDPAKSDDRMRDEMQRLLKVADVLLRQLELQGDIAQPLSQFGGIPGRCFVAMWFDESLNDVFELGISQAVTDCGLPAPIRIDRKEHNNQITDEIIDAIRDAEFVIADFTGNRGGVYYEAGFARGLGRPVIHCCRDTDFDERHFDTRLINHIKWTGPTDLREKLANRIKATIIPKA